MTRDTVTSLMDLCLESSLRYLESSSSKSTLAECVFLPEEVCEALISRMTQEGKCNDAFLYKFSNPLTSRVLRAKLQNTGVTDRGISFVSQQPLREVNLSGCGEITEEGLDHLRQCRNTLTCLRLAKCTRLRNFSPVYSLTKLTLLDLSHTAFDQEALERLGEVAVNLRCLRLRKTLITSLAPVSNLRCLVSLDISACSQIVCIEPLTAIRGSLEWLSLYNCSGLRDLSEHTIETLQQLTALHHLDLSNDDPKHLSCLADSSAMQVLSSLPRLTSLDLSGISDDFTVEFLGCFEQPLQFLGLSMTQACHNPQSIPAMEVAGEGSAQQIVTSLRVYKSRPMFLITALRELFNLIRTGIREVPETMICNLLLQAMELHQADHRIQMAGSASLYHLSHEDPGIREGSVTKEQRKRIVKVTLDAMENHIAEKQLQKNCCLTLCNFKIPEEVEFDYQRVARILLNSALYHDLDFIQRIAVGLCNLLVCQVSDERKVIVGRDLHGVEMILKVISNKLLSAEVTGEVLECCWSALWNVTDETEENCAIFIEKRGMDLFMSCKQRLGHQRNLLRNMLGLMGNVAEVKSLRPYLMEHAHTFCDLLGPADELEVSYNAAGILSHLASDGPAAWTNLVIPRELAMSRMVDSINKWNLSTSRQMSYRSFLPILRLLPYHDTPAIQHWAAWALANLSTVDPQKYCGLVRDEGGIALLQELVSNPHTDSHVQRLAATTLDTCRRCLMDCPPSKAS